MSKADLAFIEMCKDILDHGTSTKGEAVRPHWPDGTPAYTIKKFGVISRFDLSEEFPALTLRKTPVKTATDEMLWIWQQKSNNIHDLHSGVWDVWADEEGTIGKAYGYQMAQKYIFNDISRQGIEKAFPGCKFDQGKGKDMVLDHNGRHLATKAGDHFAMDQVDKVIYDLKNTPFNRRILTNMYNMHDLSEMHLAPCAYSMTFNVTQKEGHDKLTLNAILNQRSQDILAAWAFNVAEYAVLTYMLAQVCDMEPGEFIQVVADAHIYDRHESAIRELIGRTPQKAPDFWLNPEIHDFYEFTRNDIRLDHYQVAGDQIKNIPIAV